jgi:hypothetical protein
MFLAGAEGKKIVCGLMRLLDTFQPPKNGLYMKIGTLLEDQNQVGSLYRKDNIVFIV